MKFLVVGLGSMGKRRIRCLKKLGYNDIFGFDTRNDRLIESVEKYAIQSVVDLNEFNFDLIEAIVVSTPPDKHQQYMELSIEKNKPCFVEASVIIDGLERINKKAKEKNVLIAPSCTFFFHPIISEIIEIVNSGKYGKVTNFTYHSGQYLPDWHPWENVKDFYVSNRTTGGAREIVPFELTWITKMLGFPLSVKGCFAKTMDIGADIEDTYCFIMKYEDMLGAVTVDVATRYATRNLILNLEYAQITWKWDDGMFSLYDVRKKRWIRYHQPEDIAEPGYNKNIVEGFYIQEVQNFIDAINGLKEFPNNLDEDIKVLEFLKHIEDSDGGF